MMYYEVILPANQIPHGASVRKLTGQKMYTVQSSYLFKAYGQDGKVIAECNVDLSDGCRVLVDPDNPSRVNVVNGDKKLVTVLDKDELLALITEDESGS